MRKSEDARPAESREAIEERAADFLQRRRLLRWNSMDQVELDAWLRQSTAHRIAYLRLEAAVARVERVSEPHVSRAARAQARWGFRFAIPFLASAASLALVAALWFVAQAFLQPPPDRTYATDVGGHAVLGFSDHTEMDLNTDTFVRYRMTNRERTIWLERGEVWFHVAHDAAHPFTVIIGRHRVTDLGTEFLVRRKADGAEVILVNGRAALSTDGAQTARLEPGDDALATSVSVQITRKTPQQLADDLAWRRGVLVFRNARLADVVHEFNRYNATKLVLADPSIDDVKVSAELRADHYEDFLQVAQSLLKLRIDREGTEILISRGAKAKSAGHKKHGI